MNQFYFMLELPVERQQYSIADKFLLCAEVADEGISYRRYVCDIFGPDVTGFRDELYPKFERMFKPENIPSGFRLGGGWWDDYYTLPSGEFDTESRVIALLLARVAWKDFENE